MFDVSCLVEHIVFKLYFIFVFLLQQVLGCSIILALMQEYSTTVKSTDVGLTWESHYVAKKEFEVRVYNLPIKLIICNNY